MSATHTGEHDPIDPYKLYSRADAAELLGCSLAWLTELTKTGKVYSIKQGKRRMYPRAALTAYIRGENFGDGMADPDATTWPPTPSLFGGAK